MMNYKALMTDIQKEVSPVMRFHGGSQYTLRLIGDPIIVWKMFQDGNGYVVDPEKLDRAYTPAMRIVINAIDCERAKLFIVELPKFGGSQIQHAVREHTLNFPGQNTKWKRFITKLFPKYGKKKWPKFEPGGEFGLKVFVMITGEGKLRRYEVTAKLDWLSDEFRKLGEKPYDLESLYEPVDFPPTSDYQVKISD